MSKEAKVSDEKEFKNKITLIADKFSITIKLNNTITSEKLLKILPLSSRVNKWGGEIYFNVPLKSEIENGVEIVEEGTVAFWPPGSALCIFFGKTPASVGDKPQAVSPVTIVGEVTGKEAIKQLEGIKDGEKVEIR
jgi:uncharacterized protein